ncbi:phytanoyl-CoA dioxygenase, peroxisomal-like [Tetranychus urticae]|uniref:phytanoyl-CoA dioxygenase n=1 Tax=Tetranychus urticae TaxID=32264 RepID=T1KSB6_TETUR|nr:phytanoyl-CoA dioxygenase, peroxisomal-like [Tetranychus urticae]
MSSDIAANQFDRGNNSFDSTKSVSSIERARLIYNNGNDETRIGFDGSFKSPQSSLTTTATTLTQSKHDTGSATDDQEQTKSKKKPANWLDVLQIDPKVYWPKKYRYTAEPRPGSYYMLNVRERDFYEDNGFLIVKNLIPANMIGKIVSNLESKARSSEPSINSALTNETLKALISSPRISRYASAFCGNNLMAMTCSPIYDYIYSDLQSNCFQRDLHCLPFRPADRIVSVWIALESCGIEMDASQSNSVQYMVIPGSHRTGYLETIYSDDEGNKVRMFYERIPEVQRIKDEASSKEIRKITLKPGDALFYHPLLAYTVKLNNQEKHSDGQLIAISCRYASSDCDYIEITSGSTYQDEVPPHLVNTVFDYNLNKDFWRNQGLLIKGKRSNL